MAANTTFTAGAILTAAQQNNFPRGQLAYTQVVANQTGIAVGAVRDLTGLTATFVFSANRRIRISAKAQFTVGTNACNVTFLIQEGAVVLGSQEIFGPSSSPQGRVTSVIITPTAGSHTYKLTAAFGDNANNSLQASATNPSFILVEDIGSV